MTRVLEIVAGTKGLLPGFDQINIVLTAELAGAGSVELILLIGSQRSNVPTIFVGEFGLREEGKRGRGEEGVTGERFKAENRGGELKPRIPHFSYFAISTLPLSPFPSSAFPCH